MSRRFRFLFLALLTLPMAGCFGGNVLSSHTSDSGLILEEFVPKDLSMVASFSTLHPTEWESLQALNAKTPEAEGLVPSFVDGFKNSLGDTGLDYERDLKPALGDQFRFLYAIGTLPANQPYGYTVSTLANPQQMAAVLETLSQAGKWKKQELSDRTVYQLNEAGSTMLATVEQDLLLMSTDASALISMTNLDEEDSLWSSEAYQTALESVTDDFLFYTIAYPQIDSSAATKLPNAAPANLMRDQVLVLRVAEEGLNVSAVLHGDKDKMKSLDLAFDDIPHAQPYLFEEVPAERLVGYVEAYGLKQTLMQRTAASAEDASLKAFEEWTRKFFAMDLSKDILSFLDKGYVMSVHRPELGVVPGLSFLADARADLDHAEELLDKIDLQMTTLMDVWGKVFPNIFTRSELKIGEDVLTQVRFDMTKIDRSQIAALPSSVLESSLTLTYGMLGDRLLISNADVWKDGAVMVSNSELYEALAGRLSGVDEGLVLLDARELQTTIQDLSSLREQLQLEVPSELQSFLGVLDYFKGLVAQSHTNAYDVTFSGYLLLK